MKNIVLLFMAIYLLSCSGNDDAETVVKEEFTLKALQVIEQARDFEWAVVNAVNNVSDDDENLVISPLSISQAFGMAINGAAGDNLTEMLNVMGFSSMEGLNDAYKNIRGALQTADPKVVINIANSAWYRNDFIIKDDFFNQLSLFYDAKSQALNFSNSDEAKAIMNGWVKDKTNGKIPSIIDDISGQAILFLINAVYFNGEWASRFNAKSTLDAPFYLSSGNEISVKMMHQKESFETFYGETFGGVRLPYGNGDFFMDVILPNEDITASQLLSSFNSEIWDELHNQNKRTIEMDLYLPKFKLECSYDLVTALQAIGMERAFYDVTGFHNIAEAPIVISEVKHKTFIEVDERGTEAAAVTSIGFELTSVGQTPVFRFDRPFLFIISEKQSGALLFVGKIENPIE